MNNPGGSWAIDFVNRVMKYRSTIPENLRRTIRIFTLLYRYITHISTITYFVPLSFIMWKNGITKNIAIVSK